MSRNRLHVNNLEAFASYCETQGWKLESIGDSLNSYQVLRMRHPKLRDPLIVHKRLSNNAGNELVHLTTHGHSDTMLSRYLRDKKRTKANQSPTAPRVAPWPDFNGMPIHEGDRLCHPSGEVGTVVFIESEAEASDAWRVRYDGEATLSRLCLQVGDKGRATVIG